MLQRARAASKSLTVIMGLVVASCGGSDDPTDQLLGAMRFEIGTVNGDAVTIELTGCTEVFAADDGTVGSGATRFGVNPTDDGNAESAFNVRHSPTSDGLKVEVRSGEETVAEKQYSLEFITSGERDTFRQAVGVQDYQLTYWGVEDCEPNP